MNLPKENFIIYAPSDINNYKKINTCLGFVKEHNFKYLVTDMVGIFQHKLNEPEVVPMIGSVYAGLDAQTVISSITSIKNIYDKINTFMIPVSIYDIYKTHNSNFKTLTSLFSENPQDHFFIMILAEWLDKTLAGDEISKFISLITPYKNVFPLIVKGSVSDEQAMILLKRCCESSLTKVSFLGSFSMNLYAGFLKAGLGYLCILPQDVPAFLK